MNSSAERLRKILELERAKGYRDAAVIGGLDKFLRDLAPGKDFAALLSSGYATLDRQQREQWVSQMLQSLSVPGSPASDVTPAARPKPLPVKPVVASQPPPTAGAAGETPKKRRPSTKVRELPAKYAPRRSGVSPARQLDSSITVIKGIRSSLAAKFGKLGVATLRDMLYFFPRRHIDYSQRKLISDLEVGIEQTIVATVWEAGEKTTGRRMKSTEAVVGDESGNMRAVWFNQPYLANKFTANSTVVISGKVELFHGRKVFVSPEWEILESGDLVHTGRLIPVYPLTAGLYPRTVRRLVKSAVDRWAPTVADFLPDEIRSRTGLATLSEAIAQAHYPDSESSHDRARRRLAFDELFLIQLNVLSRKRDWQKDNSAFAFAPGDGCLKPFLDSLPFAFTGAQRRALAEVEADLSRSQPMSRLLQGDVGSGKTIVATAAMLLSVANGRQAAIMAPTEILAEQHFAGICGLLGRTGGDGGSGVVRTYRSLPGQPVSVGLLTGGLKEKEKRELQQGIQEGTIDIVIGTHALIQKGIEFPRLGFCVVDEQHRFGVMQRAALRGKSMSPHVLVMSATPIPRTLALTLYGDLDLSVIDELPPGRMEIKTRWLDAGRRQAAYDFMRKQVAEGRQAFVVCPLIEESEAVQTKAALVEYERLSREVFPDLRVGLLHGRMSSAEKEGAMRGFRGGSFDILVSTPVVEVGVDVPNATVMLIEGADRFGLAQLHQFRGRVGRGQHQSYCLLLADKPSEEARERLSTMERLQDGFALAEADLKLRGPGEFFGTRQSGLPDLKMARLSDRELLELARAEAIGLFQHDPKFERPQNKALALEVARLCESGGELN